MWVKICGITRLEDAVAAYRFGADAVGFVFAESPRKISPEMASAISRDLPEGLLKVGVFVDEPVSEVLRVKEFCGLDYVQLHGSEKADEIERFHGSAIKAIRVGSGTRLSDVTMYPCVKILLDGYMKTAHGMRDMGGFWQNTKRSLTGKKVIVAGGLDPENVLDVVRDLRPFGVDVSGGVEVSLGVKGSDLIERFISGARKAEQEVKGE